MYVESAYICRRKIETWQNDNIAHWDCNAHYEVQKSWRSPQNNWEPETRAYEWIELYKFAFSGDDILDVIVLHGSQMKI